MSPWQEGFEAYYDSEGLDDNPFDEGTDSYNDWQEGWTYASIQADDDLPF